MLGVQPLTRADGNLKSHHTSATEPRFVTSTLGSVSLPTTRTCKSGRSAIRRAWSPRSSSIRASCARYISAGANHTKRAIHPRCHCPNEATGSQATAPQMARCNTVSDGAKAEAIAPMTALQSPPEGSESFLRLYASAPNTRAPIATCRRAYAELAPNGVPTKPDGHFKLDHYPGRLGHGERPS